jgi:hypothetical protein
MDLMGASFHVDLYEVTEDEDGNQECTNEEYCMYEDLVKLSGGYEPFETITMPNNRTYVLCIYPFCT